MEKIMKATILGLVFGLRAWGLGSKLLGVSIGFRVKACSGCRVQGLGLLGPCVSY